MSRTTFWLEAPVEDEAAADEGQPKQAVNQSHAAELVAERFRKALGQIVDPDADGEGAGNQPQPAFSKVHDAHSMQGRSMLKLGEPGWRRAVGCSLS